MKRGKKVVLSATLIVWTLCCFRTYATDFLQLISEKKIHCSVMGNDDGVHYGKALIIHIENLTSSQINFSIPSGFIFQPEDTIYQDIIVTQTLYADIQPRQKMDFKLYGMCMEQYDVAPSIHAVYMPFKMAEEGLLKLIRFIEKNRFFSPAGQQAVWTYIQDKPLYAVASVDTSQAYQLQRFLSEITGKPILDIPEEDEYLYDYEVRPKTIIIEGETSFRYNRPVRVEWCLFSEDGVLVRELFKGELPAGLQKLNFYFDAEVYDAPVYYLKLVMDGEVIDNSRIDFNE